MKRVFPVLLAASLGLCVGAPLFGVEFPPVTDKNRALAARALYAAAEKSDAQALLLVRR